MKLTVNELRCLIDYIQNTRLNKCEERNWYLRNIYNSLSDIKEMMEESDAVIATQPLKDSKEIPY